jgi:ATP-dependent Lon protease
MARDTQTKMTKADNVRRSKRQEELKKKLKQAEQSDSDEGDAAESESDEMDVHEYRKFLSKIFPSKHLNEKIKAGKNLKKVMGTLNADASDDEEEEDQKPRKKSRLSKKSKREEEEEEEEDLWDTDSDEDQDVEIVTKKTSSKKGKKSKRVIEDDEDEDDEDEDENVTKQNNKVNIIFTIGGRGEEEWEDDDEDDSDYEDEDEDEDDVTEDEDEEVSTDEDSDEEEDNEEEEEEEVVKPQRRKPSQNRRLHAEEFAAVLDPSPQSGLLDQLKLLMAANPNDKSLQKCAEVYEEDLKTQRTKLDKKHQKQKDKNLRIFKRIVKDKNTMNDFTFYEKLDMDHQKKIIKELKEINKITRIEKPYRMTLLESTIPVEFKSAAMKKINSLRYMEPGSGEFYKSKNWVDTFMRIPFNKYEGLPISIDDGVEKCHEFMENAKNTLDSAVYGLNDAKMQIMQMLGQLLTNPSAIGTAIAIHGPPGTGKTSLVKEGISKILNRPFAFIALGGATDSSFLEGHGYTYEGSTWGKIVQILINSKCMNPVIYFDELDKISDTPRGEEIAGILTHLTDTSQNSQFHDKYFAEINFDLSKCLFIFSYNDESKVNPILKDRMYRIKTKGYSSKEKTVISNSYLLPKIREQVRFNTEDILIPNEVLSHIIEGHCNKEDGVRNLKRCLEIIYTKLNLYRLMKPGTNLFESEMSIQVAFPFHVTKEVVDKLIKRESDGLETWRNLYS